MINTTFPAHITDEEYRALRTKIDKFDAWVDSVRKRTKCRKCKGTGRTYPHHHSACTCGGCKQPCSNCNGRGYVLGWASYKPEDVPEDVRQYQTTNEEKSKVEVYEFRRDKPSKYVAYVKLVPWLEDPKHNQKPLGSQDTLGHVTTWTGDVLGVIGWVGQRYTVAGFNGQDGTRMNLRVRAINGRIYSAVYYVSSGDYCRMKAFKDDSNSNK